MESEQPPQQTEDQVLADQAIDQKFSQFISKIETHTRKISDAAAEEGKPAEEEYNKDKALK